MVEMISEKLAGTDWNVLDFFAVGVSKQITEQLLAASPVGNGTWKSGLLKGVSGVVLSTVAHSQKGAIKKVGDYVAAGLIIDAVEDITQDVVMPQVNKLLGGVNNAAAAGAIIIA